MPPARPRLLVLSGETLFRSFFDAPRQRRLSRSFRWERRAARSMARLADALRRADALLTTWDSPRFGLEVLDRAPRLRLVAHCGGEVKGRFARGLFERLAIVNAPEPMARPVAEMAVAFLLHAARNLDAHREALRRPSNLVYQSIHLSGTDETILGRPVGLVGFGRIGRAIADLLRPFGVSLLVHDPYAPPALAARYGVRFAPLPRVLAWSPWLILAAALTDSTRGMIDAKALAAMPDEATLINVGRGGLVDLAALTREVTRGRLRCALDVTDPLEPLPLRHPLRRAKGALLTPHVAASGFGVRRAMADSLLADLERFARRRPVRHRVRVRMLDRMT
jgi:phosphoglycerate dehydrogenase-like enzyme